MDMRTLEAMISAAEAPMGKSKYVQFSGLCRKEDGVLIKSRSRLESTRHQELVQLQDVPDRR